MLLSNEEPLSASQWTMIWRAPAQPAAIIGWSSSCSITSSRRLAISFAPYSLTTRFSKQFTCRRSASTCSTRQGAPVRLRHRGGYDECLRASTSRRRKNYLKFFAKGC